MAAAALRGRWAARADLAVLRSEDVLQRSEREAARKLAAAAEEALGVLQAKNAESLKGLEEEARAMRAELEETRAQLLASWQQMDRMLASRQHEMLSGLDRHAASMEERVKEFLAALDVKTPAPVGGGG